MGYYNIRWLLRAITRLGLQALFCALSAVALYAVALLGASLASQKAARATAWLASVRSLAFSSIGSLLRFQFRRADEII